MVDVKIEPSWKELLKDEFEKPYFSELIQFVKNEYKTTRIYPPGKLIITVPGRHTGFASPSRKASSNRLHYKISSKR